MCPLCVPFGGRHTLHVFVIRDTQLSTSNCPVVALWPNDGLYQRLCKKSSANSGKRTEGTVVHRGFRDLGNQQVRRKNPLFLLLAHPAGSALDSLAKFLLDATMFRGRFLDLQNVILGASFPVL